MYEKILKSRKTLQTLRERILWAKHTMTRELSSHTSAHIPKRIGNRFSKKSVGEGSQQIVVNRSSKVETSHMSMRTCRGGPAAVCPCHEMPLSHGEE